MGKKNDMGMIPHWLPTYKAFFKKISAAASSSSCTDFSFLCTLSFHTTFVFVLNVASKFIPVHHCDLGNINQPKEWFRIRYHISRLIELDGVDCCIISCGFISKYAYSVFSRR